MPSGRATGPQTPGLRSADGVTRLSDLFRGPHLTRLRFGGHIPAVTGTRTITINPPGTSTRSDALADTEGHAHRAYGVTSPATILVRPDGHNQAAIDDYLRRVL